MEFSYERIGPDTVFTFLTPKETNDYGIPGVPASKFFTEFEKPFLEILIQPTTENYRTEFEIFECEKHACRLRDMLLKDIAGELATVDKEPAKKQRKRGPNDGTLDNCERAMKLWIDQHRTLEAAAQQEGTSPKTVKNYLPTILERLDDDEKRERWEKWLIAKEHLNT